MQDLDLFCILAETNFPHLKNGQRIVHNLQGFVRITQNNKCRMLCLTLVEIQQMSVIFLSCFPAYFLPANEQTGHSNLEKMFIITICCQF